MDILRITARWSGFLGAPGYSNFHFSNDAGFWDGGVLGDPNQVAVDAAVERTRRAFAQLDDQLPSGVSITFGSEAEVLDSDSGEILGAVPVDSAGISGGGGDGGYSAASGAVVNWRTNDYRFGRRIRGRTFIVPLSGTAYEGDGTLTPIARNAIRDFGSEMVTGQGSAQFGVWSRPRNGAGGVFATAVSSSVPDMAAVLRSRRD